MRQYPCLINVAFRYAIVPIHRGDDDSVRLKSTESMQKTISTQILPNLINLPPKTHHSTSRDSTFPSSTTIELTIRWHSVSSKTYLCTVELRLTDAEHRQTSKQQAQVHHRRLERDHLKLHSICVPIRCRWRFSAYHLHPCRPQYS